MSAARWQEYMEDHLAAVREANTMLRSPSRLTADMAQVYAAQAQANAMAALALSIALTGGDLEVTLAKLTAAVETAAP